MDLFPCTVRMPAHPVMQQMVRQKLALAYEYGVAGIKPMESSRLKYAFGGPAVFQLGVTGDWMSRR
ncbi:MAG: hypothetical protein ACI8T1_003168 [Verrucomicrobiales bacterium]|jgi:hypothetical protein